MPNRTHSDCGGEFGIRSKYLTTAGGADVHRSRRSERNALRSWRGQTPRRGKQNDAEQERNHESDFRPRSSTASSSIACPEGLATPLWLIRAAHLLEQSISKFDALVELARTDALVAAMGAVFVHVVPCPAHVIAWDARIARLAVVAETGRHRWHERHTGPHRMRDIGDFRHQLRRRRRLRAHDWRRVLRNTNLGIGQGCGQ